MMDANRTWLVHDMLRAERQGTRLETSRGDQIARWLREHAEARRPKPSLPYLLPADVRQAVTAGDGGA